MPVRPWRGWLVRLNRLFHTKYASRNGPSFGTSAMSAVITGMAWPPGAAFSLSTTACDASTPSTARPRRASGNATRPPPIASSRTQAPGPARAARRSTGRGRVRAAAEVLEAAGPAVAEEGTVIEVRHGATQPDDPAAAPRDYAEGVGFEPTETWNASPVFKTGAIGH
jgi:hypothetical protein